MNLNAILEQTLAKAESGSLDSGTFFKTLSTGDPELFVFLFDEDTRLLLEQEHDYMLFIAMVTLESLKEAEVDLDIIDGESLDDMAEHNWGLIEHTSIENITESIAEHPAYALYEFLEEACTPQESHEVLSETAVELVYVKCKTLVDCAFIRA